MLIIHHSGIRLGKEITKTSAKILRLIPDAGVGEYELLIFSTGEGPFEVHVQYKNANGTIGDTSFSGQASDGKTIAYDLQVNTGAVDFSGCINYYSSITRTNRPLRNDHNYSCACR